MLQSHKFYFKSILPIALSIGISLFYAGCEKEKKGGSSSTSNEVVYEIDGKDITYGELYKNNKGKFYELEKRKYELIANIATQEYLDKFFEELGKKEGKTPIKAREEYVAKNAKVDESKVKFTLDRLKDHPRLKDKSEKEQREMVIDYLTQDQKGKVIRDLVANAKKNKKLIIKALAPIEPSYDLKISKNDVVRYGPGLDDIKPMGCEGDACKVTIVEYSEFQCPFCSRTVETAKKVLENYKGKVRWIVRNFPLGFHKQAKGAALAAHCAGKQNKYWHMYEKLFQNQRNLMPDHLNKYAKELGLDMKKYANCVANPADYYKQIDQEMAYAQQIGVSGTPAFFINGKKISGALPFESFKEFIEKEL